MDHLLTEARNPASMNLDELPAREFVELMSAEDGRVAPAVAAEVGAIARAIEWTAERMRRGGRLIYVGAGTSGRLGVLDASECPPTFGTPPGLVVGVIAGGPRALTASIEGAEDHPEQGRAALEALGLTEADTVMGIATSGRTPFVRGALAYARSVGALALGLACTPDAELLAECDLAITPLVGPEVVTGSTRLKAGTATKLVLNMLSTGVMVRLGKTYGNLMVDLRASNSKLQARARRIVRHFLGLDAAGAEELLARCGGELKTALVAGGAGVTAEEAWARLQAAGGQVRGALGGRSVAAEGPAAAELVLGVDGGGSHTVAVLAEAAGAGEPRVLGRGEAGPGNVCSAPAGALAAVAEAVGRAFAAAGRPVATVGAAWLGLAGAARAEEQRAVREWAARQGMARQVVVTTDVELLLPPEGMALVAGTGSIAWGRAADGRQARAGGWGPVLGDEGGGYALGSAALRAVVRAADGRGPDTLLTRRLLDRLGLARPDQLVGWVSGRQDRAGIAALAPEVLDAATAGDAVAEGIVTEGAAALVGLVGAVVRQLGWRGAPVPLVLAGGMLAGRDDYRGRVLEQVRTSGVRVDPVRVVVEPALGAVCLAGQARPV